MDISSAQDLKANIWRRLIDRDVYREPDNNQVAIRCPFCGDSSNDPNKTRFYVRLDIRNYEPFIFHCFKCEIAGILTPSVLRSLDINDLQLSSSLLSYNGKAMKNMPKDQLGMLDNNFTFTLPKVDLDNQRNVQKLFYLNDRMGLNLPIEEWVRLKTVFRLGDFLRMNDIQKITVSKERAQLIHDDYVGFLTTRNEFINFRNIFDNGNKRYEKYSIYKNIDNTRKFYTIPNEINLLTNEKITINIAEGVFDILGVYYHLNEQENHNMIYTAVCGSGYATVLKYFIKMGVFGNVCVNIFSDDNRQPWFYSDMIAELEPWIDEFKLFYNDNKKLQYGKRDYGRPKDEIKLIERKIEKKRKYR